jgi:hypothetical protein|tara:strand:+ start:355 stop:1647 length:1293 start_codon:yes stop_codon:yes gene_type:complete
MAQNPKQYYDSSTSWGNYQFTSLQNIIDQFIIAYVGEDKIIPKIKRTDVIFHANRALQELSFDVFKSCKSLEFTVPPTLQMPLPQDYINYTKLSSVDSSGIKHILYPTSKTSNPTSYFQDADGDFKISAIGTFTNNSKTLVLDGEYKNIIVDMRVDIGNNIVKDTSTVGGVTTITLNSKANFTGDRKVCFYDKNYLLSSKVKDSVVLTGMSWSSGSAILTAASASDAAKVKPGMVCSHDDFSYKALVLDVQGTTIYLNSTSAAAGTSENVNFVSYIESETWENYKSQQPSENNTSDYQDYENDVYWPDEGRRHGLDPQHAQVNGSYYIDCKSGVVHFSSNLSGKIVIIDYLSDNIGESDETQVHKLAEEAMYKWILCAIMSTRSNVPEFAIQRYKKEKFAEVRRAKLRLSNIKLEEITQILRGKSKQIKH